MQDRTPVTRGTVMALLALCLLGSALVSTGCAKARAADLVPDGPPLAVPLPPPRVITPLDDPEPPPAPVAEAPPPAPARPTSPARTTPRREPDSPPAAPAAAPPAPPEPPRDLRPAFDPGAERKIRDLLTRAARDLNRVDYRRLSGEGKSQYEQAKRFAEQAEQALRERNYIFANTLADKSATIAAELLR